MDDATPLPLTTTTAKRTPQALAIDIATGNWKVQATRSFITSGLATVMEDLCSEEKLESSSKIAKAAGLHPDAVYRLLRFLSTFDICKEYDEKMFTLGPVGQVLTPNNPESVAKLLLWETSPTTATMWNHLDTYLETNKNVVKCALQSNDFWSHLEENPPLMGTFLEAMTGNSNDEAFVLSDPDLSPTFDLSNYETICDLGAAEGRLALTLHQKRFPHAKYILADLADVVARFDQMILPENFETQAIDFLVDSSIPKADAYLLKHIVHDWDDKETCQILNNVAKANPDATVFIIEFGPMPGPNVPHLAKGCDLYMAIVVDGHERTQEEYNVIYDKCGYKLIVSHLLAGGNHPLYVQEIKQKM